MAKAYINKGTSDYKEWDGAAIFHDDGKLELFGDFVPLADESELPVYKTMWENNPRHMIPSGWMRAPDQTDEIVEEDDASPAFIKKVQKAKYYGRGAKAHVVIP